MTLPEHLVCSIMVAQRDRIPRLACAGVMAVCCNLSVQVARPRQTDCTYIAGDVCRLRARSLAVAAAQGCFSPDYRRLDVPRAGEYADSRLVVSAAFFTKSEPANTASVAILAVTTEQHFRDAANLVVDRFELGRQIQAVEARDVATFNTDKMRMCATFGVFRVQ